MKVTLITGVAGTTGSRILDYLVSNNKEIVSGDRIVVGFDNMFRGTEENISKHLGKPYFIFIKDDFRSIYDRRRAFPSNSRLLDRLRLSPIGKDTSTYIDEIYHMAAVVPTRYFYERPDLTYEINCQGTIDLFNWARSAGIKRFIVGSSSEIYGHIDDFPADEHTPSKFDSVDDTVRWSYAQGKLLTEHYLNHFACDMERVCHLRFANTYGVEDLDDNHIIPYLINKIVCNEDIHINKNCDQFYRTFLHNKDAARACVELMEKGRNGYAYNIGSHEEVRVSTLYVLIRDIVENMTGKPYTGKVYYDVDRKGDPKRRILDISRLKEDTGFVPEVPLADGISEMVVKVAKKEGLL